MKTLISSIILGLALTFSSVAQTKTNTVPAVIETNTVPTLPEHVNTWLDFLSTTATNWVVVPYAVYVDDDIDSLGGGIAAMYSLNQYALTGLRLDYVHDELWMPSINITLQLPIKVTKKVTVSPFAITGLATPLGGRGDDNGEAVGIFGAGLAVQVSKKVGLVYDAEMWTQFSGTQHRFGIYFRF